MKRLALLCIGICTVASTSGSGISYGDATNIGLATQTGGRPLTIHTPKARFLSSQSTSIRSRIIPADDPPAPQLVKCSTPEVLEAFRSRQGASSREKRLIERQAWSSGTRPESCEGCIIGSTIYPLSMHYRSENMAETARFALDLAEESWRLETEALGFDPPLPDGGDGGSTDLDIYLASIEETSGGAYTQPTFIDIDSTDDIQSCTTYIAISESISWELLPVYIAHELNHASQAAMDFQEIIWAWEATATFIEDKVYDDINDYYWYLPYFQGYPEKSLTCYDNTCSLYPYGASIFLHFVNEALVLEPSQIGLLWDASKQPSWGNEPDFLDALQALSQQHGWNGLDELYVHFAEWRYFVGENDDGEHFEEGQEWGDVPGAEVPLSGVFEFEDLPLQGTLEHVSDYGTVYIGLNIGGQGSGKQVRVSVESSGGVHVGTLGIRKGSESIDVFHSDDSLQPTKSETIIPLENTEDLIIGIINLGPEGYDADDAPQDSILEFKVELEREGVGGCRCSTKHDASLGVTGYGDLTLLGLLILFVARRKRSYPAQVSYGVTSRSSTSL